MNIPTKEQMLKAYECCTANPKNCDDCPYGDSGFHCGQLESDTFAFITDLLKKNEVLQENLDKTCAAFKSFKDLQFESFRHSGDVLKKTVARETAIKFAEELTKELVFDENVPYDMKIANAIDRVAEGLAFPAMPVNVKLIRPRIGATCECCAHFDACARFWYSDYDSTESIDETKRKHANDAPCQAFDYADALIKPPCEVNDVVWFNSKLGIIDGVVANINVCFNGCRKYVVVTNDGTDRLPEFKCIFRFEDFGRIVFLSKEEAEKEVAKWGTDTASPTSTKA